MPDPGYDKNDNIFDRIGRVVFGTERDVKPGRDQPSPYGDTKGREVEIPDPLPRDRGAIQTTPPGRGSTAQAGSDPNRYGGTGQVEVTAVTPEPRPSEVRPPDDRSGWAGTGSQDTQPPPDDRSGWAATGSQGTQRPPDDRSAWAATGLQPKGPVTPSGKPGAKAGGGGGGNGGAGGKRKLLGDQTRTAAYDPDLDKMDPRNIGAIDTSGNVNQQAYAASPMAHPEAYPKGTDQFTPGGETSQTIDQTGGQKPATTNALKGALDYIGNLFHQKTPDQHTAEGYTALTKGAVGAADDDTVRAVFAVVDPNNQLPYKERLELATKTAYDWYNHNGQPEKANKVAAELLQYGNKMAQSYGDQAMKELKAGNREGAIQHLKTGYGWLPDGYHAEVMNDTMLIHDTDGKVIQKIPLDDKMIQNLATGMATGTLFYDVVQHRAGVTTPFKPPQPPPQVVSTTPPGAAPAPGGGPAPTGGGSTSPAPAAPSPVPAAPSPGPGAAPAQPQAAPAGPAAPVAAPPVAPPTAAISTRPPVPPGVEETSAATPPDQPVPATPSPPVKAPPTVPAETKPAETKPVETKPAETKPAETKPVETKQPDLVREDPKDPDSLPKTYKGQPIPPHRDNSISVTPDIKRAQDAVEQADKQLQIQLQEIRDMRGTTGKKDYGRIQKLNEAEKQANKQHDNAVKAHEEVLRAARAEQRENDTEEKKHLERKPLRGQDLVQESGSIDTAFKSFVDKKDPLLPTSPLRIYNTPETWGPLRNQALELMYHNPGLSAEDAARHVITMTAHLNADKAGQAQNMNGGEKEKGGRYLVVRRDLLQQPVVQLADGTKLHVPKPVLQHIQQLRNDSYTKQDEDWQKDPTNPKNVAEAKRVEGQSASARAMVPKVAQQSEETWKNDPVGAAIVEGGAAALKYLTPMGQQALIAKYGVDRARMLVEELRKKAGGSVPEESHSFEGKVVMPPPGT